MNQDICCGMFARYRYFCHRISLRECHLDAKTQLQIKAFKMAKKGAGCGHNIGNRPKSDFSPYRANTLLCRRRFRLSNHFIFLYRRRHSYCIFDFRTGFNRNNFVARTPLGMAVSSKDIKHWKLSFSISTWVFSILSLQNKTFDGMKKCSVFGLFYRKLHILLNFLQKYKNYICTQGLFTMER